MKKHLHLLTAIGALASLVAIPLTASGGASAASSCPVSNFPVLTGTAGPGYPAPSVKVTCTTTTMTVTSNGMISYPFVQMTPNKLAAQNWVWTVPLKPAPALKTTTVDGWMGTTGFTVSGLPIYGPMEGAMPAAQAYGDPVYNKILDSCKGHTGPKSEYHYHALVGTSTCGLGASPLLGYALDGYPIYGPRGCLDKACTQVVTFESGYQRTGDPTTNAFKAYTYKASTAPNILDSCNGRIGPDGTYRYHATGTWPYTFACFRGIPTRQTGTAGDPMPAMTATSAAGTPSSETSPPGAAMPGAPAMPPSGADRPTCPPPGAPAPADQPAPGDAGSTPCPPPGMHPAGAASQQPAGGRPSPAGTTAPSTGTTGTAAVSTGSPAAAMPAQLI